MAENNLDSKNVREILGMDPFAIKSALVNLFSNYLPGTTTDSYEAGFLGWMTQALTTLSSDACYQLNMSYGESFTHLAQLRSSVNDLATMFDYSIINPVPCEGSLTVQIAFPPDNTTYNTKILNGTSCSSSSPIYKVNGDYIITIGNTPSIKRRDPLTNVVSDINYTIDVIESVRYLTFVVKVWQAKIFTYTFTINGATYGKFYDQSISGFEDNIFDQFVGIYLPMDTSSYTQLTSFKKIDNIYSASESDKVYVFIRGRNDTATIRFGNGIFGYQPEDGQEGTIILYTTMGADGACPANALTLQSILTDSTTNIALNVKSTNLSPIENGINEEPIEQMKRHIIEQITSAKRLVTSGDYAGYEGITGVNNMSMIPMLLRRDTNCNEIDLFTIIYGEDGKPAPTTSLSRFFDSVDEPITKDTIYRKAYFKGENFRTYDAINKIPTSGLENGKKYYVDDDYDTKQTAWTEHGGELATYHYPPIQKYTILGTASSPPENPNKGDAYIVIEPATGEFAGHAGEVAYYEIDSSSVGVWLFITQEENKIYWTFDIISDKNKIAYVCPYNIKVDGDVFKRATYEYIPTELTLTNALDFQTSAAGIEMSLKSTLINLIPESALEYEGIAITHFNMIHTVPYNSLMTVGSISCKTSIYNDDKTINKSYIMSMLSNDVVECNLQYSYNIPVDDVSYIPWSIPVVENPINVKGSASTPPTTNLKNHDGYIIVEVPGTTPDIWVGKNGMVAVWKSNINNWAYMTEQEVYDYNNPPVYNPNILTLETKLYYQGNLYNTYKRKVILFNSDNLDDEDTNFYVKNCEPIYLNTELDYKYNESDDMTFMPTLPTIENVDFGISTVLFNWATWKDNNDKDVNGYEMLIYLYKLKDNEATRMKCSLEFAGVTYTPYTYGVGGKDTVVLYRIHLPYDVENIPTGSINYKLSFSYKYRDASSYTNYSTYSGSVIARQMMNNTMWSTVNSIVDPNYGDKRWKIYRIPVIEKSYYDKNKKYIEENNLYLMAEIDYNFNEYKMLTDSVNIKYATSSGLTENLKYNYNSTEDTVDPIFIYNNWAWDIAPTIRVKIVIKNGITTSDSEIINETKKVILSFLTMTSTGYHKSIIKSDITRYLHDTISELKSCSIEEPYRDIIYVYDESSLPKNKNLLLSYVPEFMWVDADKISVEVVHIPA